MVYVWRLFLQIPHSPPVVNNTNEKDIFEFVFFHLEFFSVIYPLQATQDGKVEPQNNTIKVKDKFYVITKENN